MLTRRFNTKISVFMKAIGIMARRTDEEDILINMVQSMKANGKMIDGMDSENLLVLKVTYTKVNG